MKMKKIIYNFLTKNMCLKIINKNPEEIKYMPQYKTTYEMWLIAIKYGDGLLIKYLPNKYKDWYICVQAIINSHCNISDYIGSLKTSKYYDAVENYEFTDLYYIPKKYLDIAICKSYIRNIKTLKYIPDEFITDEIKEYYNNIINEK